MRDANYYEPTTPDGQTYIAGFFYSVFNEYFDRNVMTIDAFDWLHRTGANPPDDSTDPDYQACSEELEVDPSRLLGLPRPHLYEVSSPTSTSTCWSTTRTQTRPRGSTRDCRTGPRHSSATSIPLCPGGPRRRQPHQVLPRLLATQLRGPENSLTAWGDQGGPEILCDYGAAYTFMEYLASHYGADAMTALHREDGNGLVGLDTVLDGQSATVSARDTVHDWAAAVAVDAKVDTGGAVNGVRRPVSPRPPSRPGSTGTTRRRTATRAPAERVGLRPAA